MKSSKLLDDLAIFVVISNLKTAMKVSAGKYVKASLFFLKKNQCICTLKQANHSCLLHGIRAVPTETNHFL